jgi:hypothetical protein
VKDLTITLEDRPGRLADLGEATGKAGINIELDLGAIFVGHMQPAGGHDTDVPGLTAVGCPPPA